MGPCGDVRVAVQATLAWEEEGGHPRAQRGPVAGAYTKFSRAPSIGVFGFAPVWARSIFSSSRVVVRVCCLMPQGSAALLPLAALCGCVRRARRVAAGAAAAACVLRLSRWRARVAWRVRAWRLRGARAGRDGGVRLASCRMCGRGVRGFPCSCARDVVDVAAGRRRCGHGLAPVASGACSWRCRRPAWHSSARRGGGVGVALAVDAVVGCREDVVDLSESGDCLVEVQAECDEVVDRGLWDSPPGADGDDSEAAREVPWPRGVGGERRDPSEDGRIRAWGVGEPEFVLVPFVAHLTFEVGVVREGELDRRDRPGGAVDEERIGPQEGCLVWYGRDGAEGSLAVDAVACGVVEGGGQTGQDDLCRVVVPPAVVASEPVAPRKHVCEGLKCAAVRAVPAAVGAAWLAVGVDVGNAEPYARAEPEVLCVLLRGLLDPSVRDGGEGGADVGVWEALGVVVTDELLHGHVRGGGDLRQDGGFSGSVPANEQVTEQRTNDPFVTRSFVVLFANSPGRMRRMRSLVVRFR